MPQYRSYFRDSEGKIKGTQILECEDDTAAAVKPEILLAERRNYATAELWAGRRLVHRTICGDAFLLAMIRRLRGAPILLETELLEVVTRFPLGSRKPPTAQEAQSR